ncbi:MAG: hypothetical protein ACREEM_23470 [Blastocatellia bacterium]
MSSNELPVRPLNAVNRGRVVQAVYREPETANYAGNPLIEALPPVLTTEQAMLYDEAQGITDFAVKLYLFAQERAIESGKEEVTAAVIRSAARDKLRLPKPVLDALRRGDQRVLELYEDVYPAMLQAHACSPTDESGDKTASAAAIEQPAVTTPGSSPESCTISDAAGSNQS